MENEAWRPVPGFPDYEVSSFGRIKSYKRGSPKIIKDCAGNQGYRVVNLVESFRKQKTVYIHRLVALAFLGPRPEGLVVRHRDGDQNNNRLSNLIYGTQQENKEDQIAHGTHARGEKIGLAKLSYEAAEEIRRLYASGSYSLSQLGRLYGVAHSTIYSIVQGKTWNPLI